MGIGNTTPATALACWLTGGSPREMTGPGTGLDPAGVARKAEVIERALALHRDDISGPLGALRRLGGGEISVLAGVALGAGEYGLGFVCDGVIATSAAAIAAAVEPDLRPGCSPGTAPGARALGAARAPRARARARPEDAARRGQRGDGGVRRAAARGGGARRDGDVRRGRRLGGMRSAGRGSRLGFF